MWLIVHQTYLVLSPATLSYETLCYSFLIQNHIEMNFIQQPQEQKSCRRHTQCSSTMWMVVQQTYLVLSSATLSNELFCYSFLVENLVVVVCVHQQQTEFYSSTTGTEKLQEAHTIFQYTMWMIVHPTYLVLSYATLSNEIFCCSFLVKNLFVCVCASTAKLILFPYFVVHF